jgi:putative heme-binding domain-containing protein
MRIGFSLLLFVPALGILGPVARAADAPAAPPIDVLMRLKGVDLATNPAVRAALNRALAATRGTPPFLELVRAFNLTDQSAGLIDLALAHADDSTGAEALQRVIEDGGTDALREALAGPRAAAVAQALGNVSDESAPALLAPVLADGRRELAVRQAALRALVRSEAGAGLLLQLAREKKIADDLKPLAATELAGVRWPEIKDEAAQVLPVAVAAGGAIAPLETVLALRGDAIRGETLYFGAAACAACHQVQGKGIDFGPGLSEIGDKFGKSALYAAIVDPSAGIVFGYELWEITLRNGAAFGFITSETDDEIAVKAPGNIVTRHRKSEVVSRKSVPGSAMPAGLLQALEAQEIADLLEYLSRLKK